MGPKTHTTAIVLIPPRDAREPVQAIRRRHDRQVRRWMPHITLVYPFLPPASFDVLDGPLAAAARAVPAFDVELREFGRFRHGHRSWTVWLAPEPAAALADLEAALRAACPDCDDQERHPGGFHPHLSVGQFRGTEEALREFMSPVDPSSRRAMSLRA